MVRASVAFPVEVDNICRHSPVKRNLSEIRITPFNRIRAVRFFSAIKIEGFYSPLVSNIIDVRITPGSPRRKSAVFTEDRSALSEMFLSDFD